MSAGCATCGTSSRPNDTDSPMHRGVEAAEQDAEQDSLEQQVERKDHAACRSPEKEPYFAERAFSKGVIASPVLYSSG